MNKCRLGRNGILGGSRGQALVEFAVTIIACLALLFGVIEISRIMLCYTTVANAARIGARYAITNSSVPQASVNLSGENAIITNVRTVVKNFATAGTVTLSDSNIIVSFPDGGACTSTSVSCTGTTPGNRVSVTVTYPYVPLFTYYSLGTINLSSTSQGVITW